LNVFTVLNNFSSFSRCFLDKEEKTDLNL